MTLGIKPGWADGAPRLGAWCMISHPLTTEAIARSGFDWICIDMQHGTPDFDAACAMIRACELGGTTPIVRVPWNEPGLIGRVLDAGALGIIVPMIETPEDAAQAVAASLYPPAGRRSFGPLRVALRDGPTYHANANGRIAVIPMIETANALAQVDAILAVPGVDAAFVGPSDLSVALGLPPVDNDGKAPFDDALARVVGACRKAGKVPAAFSNARLAPRRIAQGFRMVSIAIDFAALASGMRADLETVKKALSQEQANA